MARGGALRLASLAQGKWVVSVRRHCEGPFAYLEDPDVE